MWCLEHMSDIDPSIEYCRVIHTDGHNWKLYEVHRSHVKKTKFFKPRKQLRRANNSNRLAVHVITEVGIEAKLSADRRFITVA